MAILWIGDFRLGQLQQYQNKTKNTGINSIFLVDDNAEINWFNSVASDQFPQMSMESADIIIMSGFNDCLRSCAWTTFNINQIADKYIKIINELTTQYSNSNFYFCSVNPVEANYPFADIGSTGYIPAETLNKKIQQFNTRIKSNCKATFIDSYTYFNNTGFNTRDGIRLTLETCEVLQKFILSHILPINSGTFMDIVRVSQADAPSSSNTDNTDNGNYLYWISTSISSGLNNCAAHAKSSDGTVLPSNIGYTWGRFAEIFGETHTLPTSNSLAEWWDAPIHPYIKGTEPQLGAVICWKNKADTSTIHTAVVEYIDKKTNSIIVSKSYDVDAVYNPANKNHFETLTLSKSANNTWGESSSLSFLGFIYCSLSVSISTNKENICTKNSYAITKEEMKPNAQYIWQYLGSRGWTINAVAALLGNMQEESKLSPCVWEGVRTDCETINAITGVHTLTATGRTFKNGYGLTQWTPATKFFTWCNNGGKSGNANGTGGVLPYWEIDTQLKRIEAEVEASERSWVEGLSQWIKKPSKGYDLTFRDFIESTKDAYWLAGAFAFCYERPARSTGTQAEQNALRRDRGEYANYWYSYLTTLAPISTTVGGTTSTTSTVSIINNASKVVNFKVAKCTATQALASFIVSNGSRYSYSLSAGAKTSTKKSNIKIENAESELVTFTLKDLIPNTKYSIKLEVQGADKKNIVREVSFSTPQDYPNSVKDISLSCEDAIKTPDSYFKLSVTKPDYLGYWGKSSGGYDKQLIVNGKCVKTKSISSIKNISANKFNIKNEFGYQCKEGDNIQIGIRVWVMDNNARKIYDDQAAITSKSICLLNATALTYLKRK